MSKNHDIVELLQSESDAVEANPDAPITAATKVTRGHDRAKKLQIRLNDDEYARIEQLADQRGVPVSTLARSILLGAIESDQPPIARSHFSSPALEAQKALLGNVLPAFSSMQEYVAGIADRLSRITSDIAFVREHVVVGTTTIEDLVAEGLLSARRIVHSPDAPHGAARGFYITYADGNDVVYVGDKQFGEANVREDA